MSKQKLDAASFEQVASSECRRWGKRAIDVARALLVDGAGLTDAADQSGMSRQQANVIRNRFLDKADHWRQKELRKFMAREAPESATIARHALEIIQLRDSGYSDEQIVAYLALQNIKTTPAKIAGFLRKHRA
jgi:hypothetical protein